MSAVAQVTIHASQFPEAIRRDLLESLRTRQVNHKFHYDSVKQTRKWLALHQVHSPSRTDADCAAIYDRAFSETVAQIAARHVHVIGLGCGGGQKDTRLLRLLRDAGREVFYTPSDVSVAMTLVARETARAVVAETNCFPFVCDLASTGGLTDILTRCGPPDTARLVTFFGMIPNFEPAQILPQLAALIRPGDTLLFSANLAPGPDYKAGVRHILPQYDNPLTRDWLLTFLFDLGVERADGELAFSVEDDPAGSGLKRVVAYFAFTGGRVLVVENERFEFTAGDRIRLFFSYRHTPARVRALLAGHGLEVLDEWIAKSEQEGVFLVRTIRTPASSPARP
jgi:uncharacterized SAM-dependent methyltransferase